MNKKTTAILLLASVLASCAACGSDEPGNDTSAGTASGNTTTVSDTVEYTFTKEYEGSEFRILNADDMYEMHAKITRDEETGESLDDAMYERCITFEELTGVTINETSLVLEGASGDKDLASMTQKFIMAGDDMYDVVYVKADSLYKYTTEGYLLNLLDYDEIQIDEPWWMQAYNDSNIINGELYSAAGYSQLMTLDSLWCLFFNEDMMTDLNLDFPYDLAREGKWTIDRLNEYITAGANLNGDTTFTFSADSRCIYGMSIRDITFSYILNGMGEFLIESRDGKLVYTGGTERFYDAVSKCVSVFTKEDGKQFGAIPVKTDDDRGSYMEIFESEQALFRITQICKGGRMRDKNFSYGIVPLPKFDEAQENYYSVPFSRTPNLSIPVTVANPERCAALADALTYLSYDIVLPTYREITLEQKNLRNDESIEMLDVVINAAVPLLSDTYNVGVEIFNEIETAIGNGNDSVASILASHKSAVDTKLAEING
ncbi:MAG: hypothetical protein IJ493_04720 [Clostridia bacterium]|nr:hypothetical protein [Clostridia bacterium]